jgi:hypothetical protein
MARQIGVEPIAHPLRIAPVHDQTSLLQGLHVPRHPALRCIKSRHQLANTMFLTICKDLDRAKAGRLREGGQKGKGIMISNAYALIRTYAPPEHASIGI